MSNEISIKGKNAIYLSLAVVLSISAMAIPLQAAQAQTTQTENFLVRLVGAVGQSGLVNIAVNNVAVSAPIDISRNNVIVPITANDDMHM